MHTPTEMDERLAEIGRRIDLLQATTLAGTSEVAAEVAQDGTFVAAVEAEMHTWDAYLEHLQVTAATTAGSTRERAEAAISELRRHRNALSSCTSPTGNPSSNAAFATRSGSSSTTRVSARRSPLP